MLSSSTSSEPLQGFLNLNKPAGLTSHDCVARVRRLLKTKKVGHGGTLDPAATGVLPIAIGRATRLLQYLDPGKAYKAVIRFGVVTTTDDLEGDVVHQNPAADLSLDRVTAHLGAFVGTISQRPPQYSAVQVQGRRLYDLARQGTAVETPLRQVRVDTLEILNWQPSAFPELTVKIRCGTGTYIRSIARDWGEAVGTGATLVSLLRTHSNGFDLAESIDLETLAHQAEVGPVSLLPPNQVLDHLPRCQLEPSLAQRWQQGQKIAYPQTGLEADAFCRVCTPYEPFLGIGQMQATPEGSLLIPKMVYVPWP